MTHRQPARDSERAAEEAAFQRKKFLIFAGLAVLVGLVTWTFHRGETTSQHCLQCQQQLPGRLLDSLTIVGSLGSLDSGYVAYYQTIRDSRLLAKLARLSQPGPALQLSGTDHKFSTHGFNLYWYQHKQPVCEMGVAQTQAGQPYTDCYAGYNFATQLRLIPMLDSLLETRPARRWYAR